MRPTLKSAAAAVFIGGCAAAGIAVASASTPASHPVAPSTVQQTGVGSTMSVEMQQHGRALHQDLHRGRDAHQGGDGLAGANDTATPSVAPSTEPGDDNQSSEPVEITSTEPAEDNQSSSQPGDNSQSSQPGEDNQSSEPGDDNGTDVPGEDGGGTSGSSSGDGGSGGGDGGSGG